MTVDLHIKVAALLPDREAPLQAAILPQEALKGLTVFGFPLRQEVRTEIPLPNTTT